jgi:hypothetical protein
MGRFIAERAAAGAAALLINVGLLLVLFRL